MGARFAKRRVAAKLSEGKAKRNVAPHLGPRNT